MFWGLHRGRGGVFGMPEKPLILVDVDGVLNIFPRCHPPYCKCHPGWLRRKATVNGRDYRLHLNPTHGRKLLRLADETAAELAWGSTWEDHANTWIGPLVGLPRLPFAPMPFGSRPKARGVVPWCGDRPFVWFDDEPDVAAGVAELATGPHLVVAVDERVGLEDQHLARAREWLLALP